MRAGAIALLAVTAVSSAAGPAAADFRYVAPAAEAVAEDAEASTGDAGGLARTRRVDPADGPEGRDAAASQAPPGGEAEPAGLAPDPGLAVWRVHEGETLREVLARWGARAGMDVLFLTDRRYRLDGAAAFEGGFGHAVQALFRGLSHLPHAPVAARSEGGTTLVVRHRSPRPPEKGEEP